MVYVSFLLIFIVRECLFYYFFLKNDNEYIIKINTIIKIK